LRTGGEEFTGVFPDTTHDEAGRIANPVMAAVRAAHIGAQRQPDRLCLGGVLAPVA
jgi:PleD family two-component response regulator